MSSKPEFEDRDMRTTTKDAESKATDPKPSSKIFEYPELELISNISGQNRLDVRLSSTDISAFRRAYALIDSLKQANPPNTPFTSAQISTVAITLTSDSTTPSQKYVLLATFTIIFLNYSHPSTTTSYFTAQTPTIVFTTRRATCLGFSLLYKHLCNASSLPCRVVFGYCKDSTTGKWDHREGHAWNEIDCDGPGGCGRKWVDITWAAGPPRGRTLNVMALELELGREWWEKCQGEMEMSHRSWSRDRGKQVRVLPREVRGEWGGCVEWF